MVALGFWNRLELGVALPITLAHRMAQRLAEVRKDGKFPYLRPDGKTQVTVEYDGDQAVRADTVVLSTQHDENAKLETIRADLRGTASRSSRQLAALALALGAYFVAVGVDTSGFIAAFAAGLAFGMGHKERVESAVAFTEAQATLLSILVWLIFGLIVFGEHVLGLDDPMVLVYAALSVTVIRMLPVALALAALHR